MVPASGVHDLTEAHRGTRHLVLRGAGVDGEARVWKTVAPGHPAGAAAAAALEREHDLLLRLGVRGIARPLGMATIRDRPALVLADAGPVNLKQWLRRRALSPDVFLALAMQLTETLVRVHEGGVLHRDVNPSNIVVGPGDRLTLVDFGAATVIDGTGVPAHPAGSLPYMAPEETGRMNRLVDHRADLYSLGATFYEMLTGGPPFPASDPVDAVHAQLAQAPVPPDRTNPALPSVLSAITLKLLAKVPERRYQSAEALLADLKQAVARTHQNTIAGFELGLLDQARALPMPARLYGRAEPLAALSAAWGRAATGKREVVIVEGPAGVGKSAVVLELTRAVKERQGWLLHAKFDLQQGNLPFAPLAQAFRELVRALAAEPEPARRSLRERLQEALGGNGRVLTEVLPELEELLGPQPAAPALGPLETQNRFQLAFEAFVRTLATADRPLLLFLDDLQWADPASLRLFDGLAAMAGLEHVLLIGARRPAETGPGSDLGGAAARRMVLGPLPADAVLALCCDTLRCRADRGRPLAELVADKTAGNPFFVAQLLRHLHQSDALHFDADLGTWTWDLARVRAVAVSDNVVDLLLSALRRLPERTQEVLQRAAGLGNKVALGVLATAWGRDRQTTASAAWSAVAEGLLLSIDEVPTAPEAVFQFAHDRVQQAAYALLDPAQREAAHLDVGRRLLRAAGPHVPDESLFLILGQLDRATALISEPAERLTVAELSLRAAVRARQSSGFAQALDHVRRGIALLPPDAWRTHHGLTFALHRHALECAHFMDERALAARLLESALAGTAERAELGDLYDIEVLACTARIEPAEAVRRGLEGLRLFGVHPPADEQGMAEELAAITANLRGRTPEQLLEAPRMTDPDHLACVRLLAHVMVPAFGTRQELWAFLVARLVNLTLAHGNAALSAPGFISYAILVQRTTGDYAAGYAWGRMAAELSRRAGDPAVECRAVAVFAAVINDWCASVRVGVALAQRAGALGLEAGELLFGTGCNTTALILRHHQGVELGRLLGETEAALVVSQRANVGSEVDAQLAVRQSIRCLQGLTRARNSFDDAEFDEAGYFGRASSNMRSALYTMRRLETSYLLGDLEQARARVEEGTRALPYVRAFVLAVEHAFYSALTLAAGHASATAAERLALLAAIEVHRGSLARWAANCPENYRAKLLLVEAEVARLEGQFDQAGALYDESIQTASREGFLKDEAIGNELAGRMYHGLGRKRLADFFLSSALDAYARWGAHAKEQALREEFPELSPIGSSVAVTGADPRAFDLMTLSRAAEAISSELVLDRLLEKLLQVCLATAGAERGALLLEERGQLYLRGTGQVAEPVVLQRTPLAACRSLLPVSIVEEVHRNDRTVVIGDASRPGQGGFAGEPYLSARAVRSVLALPVRRQGRRVGVLYLENNLCAQAFTVDRVQVLQLLSAQIATSLQISALFEGLTHEVDERKRAEGAVRFLADASVALAGSLDDQTTVALAARVAVGFLADWCVVDLFEDGKARRAAAAHVDPRKEPLLLRLREHQDRLGPPVQAVEMRAHGRPILIRDASEGEQRRYLADPEAVHLARQIGVGSCLILPLRARERLLGTMTLVSDPGGRRYDERDLALGEELARRCAMAIDNAHLYKQSRDAVRLRDEFLSIASHELNTPIAALQLSVEGLEQAFRGSPAQISERLIRLITRQSRRLGSLVQGLLSVAELQAGRLHVDRIAVDLSQVVREISEEMAAELTRARCELTVRAPAPVEGIWDRVRLDQIVTNLLSNAIKYGGGSPIQIAVDETTPGTARLIVEDHGIGIDPERLRHVFGRFERAVPATNYGGMGLGLYVVREITGALGGTVSARSTPGQGATFVVELPMRPAQA